MFSDLAPYTCLYKECISPETEFTTFHAWIEHTRARHWHSIWLCPQCEGAPQEYLTRESFVSHWEHDHSYEQGDSDLAVIAKYSQTSSSCSECLICGSEEGITETDQEQALPVYSELKQYRLQMCMANHLESLALSSLPWHIGIFNDSSSSKAQGSDIQAIRSDDGSLGSISSTPDVSPAENIAGLDAITFNAAQEADLTLNNYVSTWSDHTYVDIQGEGSVVDDHELEIQEAMKKPLTVDGTTAEPIGKVSALFGYVAESSRELSFRKFDLMEIFPMFDQPESITTEWWLARRGNQSGLIPQSHVELVDDHYNNLDTDYRDDDWERPPRYRDDDWARRNAIAGFEHLEGIGRAVSPILRPGAPPPPAPQPLSLGFDTRNPSDHRFAVHPSDNPRLAFPSGEAETPSRVPTRDLDDLKFVLSHEVAASIARDMSYETLLLWDRMLNRENTVCGDGCNFCSLLNILLTLFKQQSSEHTAQMSFQGLGRALAAWGYSLSNEYLLFTYQQCMFSSESRQDSLSLNTFCRLGTAIHWLTGKFKAEDTDRDGFATYSFEEYLQNHIELASMLSAARPPVWSDGTKPAQRPGSPSDHLKFMRGTSFRLTPEYLTVQEEPEARTDAYGSISKVHKYFVSPLQRSHSMTYSEMDLPLTEPGPSRSTAKDDEPKQGSRFGVRRLLSRARPKNDSGTAS